MLALIITVLRGLFLILLYLFIFRLTVSMIEQFKIGASNKDDFSQTPVHQKLHPKGGGGAILGGN